MNKLHRTFRIFALLLATFCIFEGVQAQRGIGFRFASDFNYFFRAEQQPLHDGWWSQMVVGTYYQAYFDNGGAQIGLNLLYKNGDDKGFPNMPVIQRDYGDNPDQNIGVTALELDLKVGPRFGIFNPKIGYLISYHFTRTGFLEPGNTDPLNRVFVSFPLGLSVEGPTGYGSVGFGVYYEIGLNNVIKNPLPGLQDFDGSKIRGLNFEFVVMFMAGSQKQKNEPVPIEEFEDDLD